MRVVIPCILVLFALGCDDKSAEDTSSPSATTDDTGSGGDDTGSGGDDTGSGGDDTGSGGDDTGSAGDDTGAGGDDTGSNGETTEPDVAEFGLDDTRTFEVMLDAGDGLDVPRDVDFHPERDELWVTNRYGLSGIMDGGSATIVFGPEGSSPTTETRADAYAYHFMDEVSSLAFGDVTYVDSTEITFGTCQESRNDYGGFYNPDNFMGPALWPSDLDLFAEIYQNHPIYAGSHLDMLHESPLCMGIAHEVDNVYWAFDGWNGHLVRYDFQEDHGPGEDDHSDGIVRRYQEVQLTRVEDVPGHMEIDASTGWLYIADTGAGRILRVDIDTGEVIGLSDIVTYEYLAEYTEYGGVVWEVFAEGLSQPSGLAVGDGRLFVADYATAEIVAYDLADGSELGRIDTDAAGIMGLGLSPGGHLWYADGDNFEVVRIDPGI